MSERALLALILGVALASYALRVAPLALLRRPLRDPHLVAFISYLPYAILAAMIVPGILSSAGGFAPSLAGAAVALLLALLGRPLPAVAAASAAAALIVALLP